MVGAQNRRPAADATNCVLNVTGLGKQLTIFPSFVVGAFSYTAQKK